MKLKGKVAVVTGAASGMGEAIARLYAQEGAKVVLSDIDEQKLNQVVNGIKEKGGEATGIVANVTDDNDITKMLDTAKNNYGSLDIVVNNAGIMDNFKIPENVTNNDLEKVLAVNLTGPFKICRESLKIMTEQGSGVIINNASVGGLYGVRGGAAYVTSKHGLLGLTKNIAATHMNKGIRCNAIAPGGVDTNIQTTITDPDPLGQQAIGALPEAPIGKSEEIAAVALFLASDDSSFVNGATIVADGGWTAF